jgi:integrase
MSAEEVQRLLAVTEVRTIPEYGAPGPVRAMCYRLAAATGFRANELRSLTPESFDLDGVPPTCTVEAASSKRRKRDVQPLPLALVPLLRSWLEESPQRQPVFIGIAQDTARMLRADLAAARRAWIEEAKDDEPETERRKQSHFLAYRDADDRVADFHSLRVLFISRVVAGGASVREAQTLARHSTQVLTMNVYSRGHPHGCRRSRGRVGGPRRPRQGCPAGPISKGQGHLWKAS